MSKNPTKGADPVASKKEEPKPSATPAKGTKPGDNEKAPLDQSKAGKTDANKPGDNQAEQKGSDRKSLLLPPQGTSGSQDSLKTPATSSTNLIKQPEGAPVKSKEDKKQASISIPQPVVAQKPKPPSILKESGLIDAYDHFLKQLCKNGLPSGNIFEYAAQEIVKFEKKRKMDIAKKNAQKQERAASPQNKSAVLGQKQPLGKDQADKNKQKDSTKSKDQPNNNDKDNKGKDTPKPAQKDKDGKVEQKKPNDNAASKDKVAEQPKGKEEKPKKK